VAPELKEKILKHLEGLHELEHQKGSDEMIEIIAERYNVPRKIVEQVIAEWSAGRKKLRDDDQEGT